MSALNRARGETCLKINGKTHTLCLTMGALAQIEASLDADGLEALSQRLRHLSAVDILAVLAALLMGGGNPLDDEKLRSAQIDPQETAEAVAMAFSLAVREA